MEGNNKSDNSFGRRSALEQWVRGLVKRNAMIETDCVSIERPAREMGS
jgi:hypothetical protein